MSDQQKLQQLTPDQMEQVEIQLNLLDELLATLSQYPALEQGISGVAAAAAVVRAEMSAIRTRAPVATQPA